MDTYTIYTACVVTLTLIFNMVAAYQRHRQYKVQKKQVKKHDSTHN